MTGVTAANCGKASSTNEYVRLELNGETVLYINPTNIDIVFEKGHHAEFTAARDADHGGKHTEIKQRDGRRTILRFERAV